MKKIVFILLIAIPTIAIAQDLSYYLSAPIPGIDQESPKVNDLADYISYLFPFILSIAAILALTMFVIGGIQYMISSGSENTKDAKERISSALLGLGLAVFSVLILQVINPNLVKLKIDIQQVNTPARLPIPGPGPGPSGMPPPILPPPLTGQCGGSEFGSCPTGQACAPCSDDDCPGAQSSYICRTISYGGCTTGVQCRPCSQEEMGACARFNPDATYCTSIKIGGTWRRTCSQL